MTRRHTKQAIYGTLYLAVIAVLVFVVFRFSKPQAACCEISFLPLSAGEIQVLPVSESAVSLIAEITNPNLEYGASDFSYQFLIYGKDNALLQTVSGTSFIYAGEIKMISETLVEADPSSIGRVDWNTAEAKWESKSVMRKPTVDLRAVSTETDSPSIKVKAYAVNAEPFAVPFLRMTAVLYDEASRPLAVSATAVENLNPSETRELTVNFLKGDWIGLVAPAKTRVFFEVR